MTDELKAGDVVRLKSGGPEMTIEAIDLYNSDHDLALCKWFEANKLEKELFELTSLEKMK